MRSDDLTREQARALKNKIQPMLGYLHRLKKRMHHKGFPLDNELLDLVVKAEGALHELHVATHYLACGDTAGGLPRKGRDRAPKGTLR